MHLCFNGTAWICRWLVDNHNEDKVGGMGELRRPLVNQQLTKIHPGTGYQAQLTLSLFK